MSPVCSEEMLDAGGWEEKDLVFDPFDDAVTSFNGIPLLLIKL